MDVYVKTKKLSPSQISFVVTNVNFWTYRYSFSRQWKGTFLCTRDGYQRVNLENKLLGMGPWGSTELGGLGPFLSKLKVTFIVMPIDKKILSFNWGLVLMRYVILDFF